MQFAKFMKRWLLEFLLFFQYKSKVIDNVKFISESYFIAHVMIKYVIWLIFSVV